MVYDCFNHIILEVLVGLVTDCDTHMFFAYSACVDLHRRTCVLA